jgi:hypothetical protein
MLGLGGRRITVLLPTQTRRILAAPDLVLRKLPPPVVRPVHPAQATPCLIPTRVPERDKSGRPYFPKTASRGCGNHRSVIAYFRATSMSA